MASISTWWVPQITPHPEQCCCCRRCLCLKPLFNYKEEDRTFSGWVSCLMRQNETSHTQPNHDTPRQLGYLTNLMSMTSALLWLVVLTSASISLILCLPEVKKHHSSSLVKKIFSYSWCDWHPIVKASPFRGQRDSPPKNKHSVSISLPSCHSKPVYL